MTGINLVMPMAGRGSRFAANGIPQPKPLIKIGDKPFFWWAVESLRQQTCFERMIFVILEEHKAQWSLDKQIHEFYPKAEILAIPEVTSGSAETAAIGMTTLNAEGPVAVNDCDHAFLLPAVDMATFDIKHGTEATLLTFGSQNPNYSYARIGADGFVAGTVEKQVVSDLAVAGCYLFRSSSVFLDQYSRYAKSCPYAELFVSGIYNQLHEDGHKIGKIGLQEHFAFGTPEEYADVQLRMLNRLAGWR